MIDERPYAHGLPSWRGRWAPAWLVAGATGLAAIALAAHAWPALEGAYLNYVSGIWLALGRDLTAGVFFRDLIGPAGYGGTRYFPLFFVLIAALLRAGLPPLAAGWGASAVAGALLAGGLARMALALGAPRRIAWLAAAAALAPYFVQQTMFEIRADVLAAALNLWGLAAAIRLWRDPPGSRPRCAAPAAWFTLALATKVTSLAVPGCVIFALVLSRRLKAAVHLAATVVLGAGVFLAAVELASAGRALRSWRACMFAGTGGGETLRGLLTGGFVQATSHSHVLAALAAVVILGLLAAIVLERRGQVGGDGWPNRSGPAGGRVLWLPVVLFAGVTATTGLTLSSPGTVASNQVVEWVAITTALLLWIAASRRELTLAASVACALFVVWMSAQDLRQASQLWQLRAGRTSPAVRQEVADFVKRARTPVLAESALWPVLAGQQAYMLDPFALRVVMMTHPEVTRDVEQRVDACAFSSVIFQVDPESAVGRGYYENVNFGWRITSRILANYRFDRRPARDVWIYVPRDPATPAAERIPR